MEEKQKCDEGSVYEEPEPETLGRVDFWIIHSDV
jgi:hypothetical protein